MPCGGGGGVSASSHLLSPGKVELKVSWGRADVNEKAVLLSVGRVFGPVGITQILPARMVGQCVVSREQSESKSQAGTRSKEYCERTWVQEPPRSSWHGEQAESTKMEGPWSGSLAMPVDSSDLGGKGRRVKVQGQPGQLSSMVELPQVQSLEPQTTTTTKNY